MAGWGDLFGKIAQQFQGRIERVKNEREGLLNERQQILSQGPNARSIDRINAIDKRLSEIDNILRTKASD